MAAAKARARAEAERTRAYYVKKETEMKVEKVRMEGSLTALEHEKEAAAAMAEARILEEAVESMEEGSYRSHSPIAPAADPVQRTSDYVEQHTNNSIVVPPEEISLATPPVDFMNLYGSENKQLKESSHRSVPPDFVEQVNDSVSKPYANKNEKGSTTLPSLHSPFLLTLSVRKHVLETIQALAIVQSVQPRSKQNRWLKDNCKEGWLCLHTRRV